MEKKTIKISLLLFSAILICATIDLILSYNYFLNNPELFIKNEGNIEFINFLIKGEFPITNILKIIISLPLLLFILSWFDAVKKFIYPSEYLLNIVENIGRYSTISVSLFFCVLYIFSGFTWYDHPGLSINSLLPIIEKMINTTTGLIMFILFIITCYILTCEIRFKTYTV